MRGCARAPQLSRGVRRLYRIAVDREDAMLRRPRGIGLVATWVAICGVFSLAPSVKTFYGPRALDPAGPTAPKVIHLLLIVATFVLVRAVLRMRLAAIWISVGLLSLWVVSLIIKAPFFISASPHPVRAAIFLGALVFPNLLAIWYLSRRSFRQASVQYRKACEGAWPYHQTTSFDA